jgi:spermidine synthase
MPRIDFSREGIGSPHTRPAVAVEDGRKVLRVGGVIQSVAVDAGYESDVWDAMLPDAAPANALILGLGGGTIAALLTQRYGPLPIVGVERDPAVAWLARHAFGLDRLPNVRVVVVNAFTFVHECRDPYDTICVDLYVAGKMVHGVLAAPFLRDVARILSPEGLATFNLWRSPYLDDQLRRLSRILHICGITEVDENIIVRCSRLNS